MAEEQHAQEPPKPRRRFFSLLQWESQVDRAIREAQEKGQFDNLPSTGKPLEIEPWEGEWGMAHHILKQSGETLPWIALGREIEERRDRLKQMLEQANGTREKLGSSPNARTERDRLRHRYLAEAADVDKMMERFSFEIPIRDLDKGRLPRHIAEQRFDSVWPLSDIWQAEEQRSQPDRTG